MKVKDIVLSAAHLLGIYEEVHAYFTEGEDALKREAELLLECFNRVEGSLALEYLPLYAEDTVLTISDRLEYSSLTYAPVRILSVENGDGKAVTYTKYPTYLKARAGMLKVTYTYTPDKKGIEDDCDFQLATGESMFVHGVLAEYCLSEGRLQESAEWEEKYKHAIEAAFLGRKCRRLQSRRWV